MGSTRCRVLQERIVHCHSHVVKTCWFRGFLLLSWLGLLSACALVTPAPQAAATTPDSAKVAPALQMALQGLDQGKSGTPNRWVQNAQGRIQVYVYVRHAPGKILPSLQRAGLTHMVNVPELNLVQGWVAPARIPALTRLSGVTRITLPRYARPR